MKNHLFPHILKCIRCKQPQLVFTNNNQDLICKNCNSEYHVKENVPILLPAGENSPGNKSEVHDTWGTTFNYIDHYQKDAFNSDYFEKRDRGTEHIERRVREYIKSKVTKMSGLLLDVGCGKAWAAEMFCPQGMEVISMDISLLNTSKALRVHPYSNHHAVAADVFHLPFINNSFDYIIASEIIEHLHDPATFIEILIQALKPGGKLIVTTPYKEKLQYILCIHCNKPTPIHAHIKSFDEHVLRSLYPGREISKWSYSTFGNKVLLHLRTHIFLKFLPFLAWKITDKMFNLLYYVPARILCEWEKDF